MKKHHKLNLDERADPMESISCEERKLLSEKFSLFTGWHFPRRLGVASMVAIVSQGFVKHIF